MQLSACMGPVSYTHLDVYKRQVEHYLQLDSAREKNLNMQCELPAEFKSLLEISKWLILKIVKPQIKTHSKKVLFYQ